FAQRTNLLPDLPTVGHTVLDPWATSRRLPAPLPLPPSPTFYLPALVKKPQRDLTQGPILGHLIRMALPMMIGMTAHMFQNIYDGVLAGRLGIHESMAVLNYGFPFFYLIFAVLNGLSTGATSILARLLGAGEDRKASDALGQIAWINLGIVLAAGILYPLVLPWYLSTQGASPE